MPYVNIKITNEGATKEQKAKLVAGATELLSTILGKNPATTVVVIDEVATVPRCFRWVNQSLIWPQADRPL